MNHAALHAFTGAGVVSVAQSKSSFAQRLLARFFIKPVCRYIDRYDSALAASSFRENAIMGDDCFVSASARCVNLGSKSNVLLGNRVVCRGIVRVENVKPARLEIGDETYIGDDCIISCMEEVVIGNWVSISHGVHIFDNASHPSDAAMRRHDVLVISSRTAGPRPLVATAPVRIGNDAWLGFNAVVLMGVTIGEGSIIAPGSVVTQNIPEYTFAAGNPARIISRVAR